VLSSLLATAEVQQRDPVGLLVPLLCAPSPVLAELGGPPHLLEHLAQLIADHPTGPHNPTR
jgi:hypothetical protein